MVAVWGPRGYFAPNRFDADIHDCLVEGSIPADIDGAFYRLSVDFIYPPNAFDALSADGYVSRFRIRQGVVDYRGRYVRTERLKSQQQARRQLFGAYRNPLTDDPSVRDTASPRARGAANTTPLILAGRLLATKEDALPYEIDPVTLDTIGYFDFAGALDCQTFTAHSKVDPATGETYSFSYEADGLCSRRTIAYCFDTQGNKTWECAFDVPYTSLLHDMWLTNEHMVIPGGGAFTSMELLERGQQHWAWDDSLETYYVVIPRHGKPEDIRIVDGPLRAIIHTINGHSDGDKIILDAPAAEGNTWYPLFPAIDGSAPSDVAHRIRRFEIDLAGEGSISETILFPETITNFTRIDERFACRPNRYTWVQCEDPSRRSSGMTRGNEPGDFAPTDYIVRFDLIGGGYKTYHAGAGMVLQEPCFVPRQGSTEEGDGYLLAAIHNVREMRGELVIVDAMEMTELARVIMPFRLAPQIHGTWADPTMLRLD